MLWISRNVRVLLAFIFSPLIGILVPVLFTLGPVILGLDVEIGAAPELIAIGAAFFMPAYVVILLISIPIFLTIRHFIDWSLKSCIIGSVSITVIVSSLAYIGAISDNNDIMTNSLFFGLVLGSIVYGLVFWFLSSYNTDSQRRVR